MGNDIVIQYNNKSIFPTPILSQTYQFVDYGTRWGQILELELNGLLTGITGTGIIGSLTSMFSGNFGTINVVEATVGTIYLFQNLSVFDISLNNNPYLSGAFVPYTVKLRSYSGLPFGVTDPVNEYSFNQGADGIVSITHKTSAKGFKTSSNSALSNAIGFVTTFTGQNPFQAAFIPSGTNVMMSLSETINRAEGVYAVTEVYKYSTGQFSPYLESFNLDVSDIVDNEFLTMDANLKIQGSPVTQNLSAIEPGFTQDNIINRIANLGIFTGNLYKNSFSVTRDSGAATIDIKVSYVSGYSNTDMQGYFDYNITFDLDSVLPKENWKVEGEWVCKGPLEFRSSQLLNFKSSNGPNYRNYLSGLIVTSPLWPIYHNATYGLEINPKLDIVENTGMAIFKLAATFTDGTYPPTVFNPKYEISSNPSKWNFELLPSANIEGHYVVQDPQMRTQSKVQISVAAESLGPGSLFPTLSGYMDQLSGIYLTNAYLVQEVLETGNTDISYKKNWLGQDTVSSGMLYSKVVGSTSLNYVRPPGYYFGF